MRQQNICPVCAQALGKEAAKKIVAEIPCGPVARGILDALATNFGTWMLRRRIAAIVYADDPNGGPTEAENCISVHLNRVRPKLARRGLAIDGNTGSGMRMIWRKNAAEKA